MGNRSFFLSGDGSETRQCRAIGTSYGPGRAPLQSIRCTAATVREKI